MLFINGQQKLEIKTSHSELHCYPKFASSVILTNNNWKNVSVVDPAPGTDQDPGTDPDRVGCGPFWSDPDLKCFFNGYGTLL